MKRTTAENPKPAPRRSSTLVLERKGSDVFVNGYRVLVPSGRRSVSSQKLRDAARRVAEKRTSES